MLSSANIRDNNKCVERQCVQATVNENMATVAARSLKDLLSIKIKSRHDSYSDQFSRLFMTKMFVIASVIMGVDYFSDRVSCIVPTASGLSKDYVHSVCWISGFFIYTEMEHRQHESSYYGIPSMIENDGINQLNKLCAMYIHGQRQSKERNHGCEPMTKIFYLQHQWMPFYIASLGILYYLPYVVFRIVNTDLISLKSSLKAISCDSDEIVRNYFNYKINPILHLRIRVFLNILIKVLYIIVNISGFYLTNYLLLGNYAHYGIDYIFWARENSSVAHDIKMRSYPKPGNKLLPSMGFCEIHEAHQDIRVAFHSRNKFICEISPNILYQYVLMVLWFMFVVSIAISIVGFLANLSSHISKWFCLSPKSTTTREITKVLTLRETEYLSHIRKKNMVVYGDVLRRLKQQRVDMKDIADYFNPNSKVV